MAWRCPGDKPLSEPMIVSLAMHICVTRPQRVNLLWLCTTLSHNLNQWWQSFLLQHSAEISLGMHPANEKWCMLGAYLDWSLILLFIYWGNWLWIYCLVNKDVQICRYHVYSEIIDVIVINIIIDDYLCAKPIRIMSDYRCLGPLLLTWFILGFGFP